MLVVPTMLFVVPALAGHPALSGDNLIQNFPLRVLSGRQLASGHLPLFNPLANSGTPLLGGLNAGALYPLTWIFAFVTPIVGWVINCIAVYVIAATGMFALLRWHGVATKSSFAAAMTYSYSGAMIGQLVHLGVVQGFAFIPWTVLIVLSLSRRLSLESADTPWLRYARMSRCRGSARTACSGASPSSPVNRAALPTSNCSRWSSRRRSCYCAPRIG
jgi:hypothetical protein